MHNVGSCPALILGSIAPDTMKSATAMIGISLIINITQHGKLNKFVYETQLIKCSLGLKAAGDPSGFLELNSTNAAIDAKRDASSLPCYFDDADKEYQQKNALVGSLQAGTKVTKSGGKLEKLGGLIITKNFNPNQKMADKIIQGRANILIMDPDPEHE